MSAAQYVELTQQVGFLAKIDPQSATTAQSSGWVSAAHFRRFCAVLWVGAIAAGGTVDFVVQQATDNSGTGAKTVKAATQLTDNDDNKRVAIEFKAEDMDVDNGFTYLRILVTPAIAAALIAAELFGLLPRHSGRLAVSSAFDEVVRA